MPRGISLRTTLLAAALCLPAAPAMAETLADQLDMRDLSMGQQIAMQGNAALVEIRQSIKLAPIALPAPDQVTETAPWMGSALDDARVSHVVLTAGCKHQHAASATRDT